MDSNPTEKQLNDDQKRLEKREMYENKRKRRCSSTPTSDETPQKKSTLLTAASASTTPLAALENNKNLAISQSNCDDVADKLEGNVPLHEIQHEFLLEEFCDEVLYEIFKFLDTWSLMALMNVCKRFQKFVLDKRLWQNIDLSQEPLPLGILEDMLERSHDKTQSIKLRGPSPSQHIEGEIQHFNETIRISFATRCTKLVTLELYGVTLDFKQISIKDFPRQLKRLVLNNCNVRVDNNKDIFTGIDTILINLEELAIENNAWFDPYYVLPISKLPSLRYLSLKGCSQMQEFIPYGSIAARHGFKKLEILDLRDAPLSDSDLQCFNIVETLKEIYLQSPADDLNSHTLESEDGIISNASTSSDNSNLNLKPTTETVSLQSNGSVLKANCGEIPLESPSTSGSALAKNDMNDSKNSSFILNDNESSSSSSSNSSSSTSSSSCSPWPYNSASASSYNSTTTTTSTATVSTTASPSSSPANSGGLPSNAVPLVGSNTPPRSRFLPRPDHIIYLDVRNPTSPNAVHINIRDRNNVRNLRLLGQQQQQQQPGQNQQSPAFDQMIRHNLFWDIINPLGRAAGGAGPVRLFGEDNVGAEFGGALNANHLFSLTSSSARPTRGSISDRGVCCFGRTRQPVQQGVIWIRFNNRPSENRFERFSVRDYKFVTDVSLQHLVQCSPHLVFLDVSGTSVTLDGVQRFKDLKPECKVVAEHLLEGIATATTNSEITVS